MRVSGTKFWSNLLHSNCYLVECSSTPGKYAQVARVLPKLILSLWAWELCIAKIKYNPSFFECPPIMITKIIYNIIRIEYRSRERNLWRNLGEINTKKIGKSLE